MSQTQDSKGAISPKQQLHFLKELFQKMKSETQLIKEDQTFFELIEIELQKYNQSTFTEDDLRFLILNIKKIIASIESKNKNSMLLKHFETYGIYRIFFHNSVVRGVDDRSGLMSSLKGGYIGVGIATLLTALFATSALLGAPLWVIAITSALFAASVTYLSALVYGVLNDLFATKANLPYFLLGHQPQQHSLLRTNDPAAQGIAWGIAATHPVALAASIAFGIGTMITAAFVPVASFIFPVMFVAMPIIAWGADLYAQSKAKRYIEKGHEYYTNLEQAELGSNLYQLQALAKMSPNVEDRAAWLANSDRNMFGFTKLPLIGVGVLAATITLSAVHSLLPALLFSSLLATTIPVVFAGTAILFLVTAGIYTYVNRNKQIDNQYKLAFEPTANLKDELYLHDDLVEDFTIDYPESKTVTATEAAPLHFPHPVYSAKPSAQAELQSEEQRTPTISTA